MRGISPLYLACFVGNNEIIKILINTGADPFHENQNKKALPLFICVED